MALNNELDFEGIQTTLENIKVAADEVQTNLDAINNEIITSVGEDGSAWDGVAASEFRQSWDNLAANIGDYKTTVNNQIENIQMVIEKMSATDESGSGAVEI